MVKAYMTNGTLDFLLKLEDKHPNLPLHFMTSSTSTLAYYEASKKNIFVAGRAYEICVQLGNIHDAGFVIMNNIPVTTEGRPVFEDSFKKNNLQVASMPGFQAFRLLRPVKGNTYIIFTQWESEADFENSKKSEQFTLAHQGTSTNPPAYFADRPFITTYHMYNPNDEKKPS